MSEQADQTSAHRHGWIVSAGLLFAAGGWLALRVSEPPTSGFGRLFFGLWRTRDLALGLFCTWLALTVLIRSRSHAAFFKFVALNVGVVGVWLAVECGALLGILNLADDQPSVGMVAIPHMDVAGEMRENIATRWGIPSAPLPYHYRTDARGFRNHEDRDGADIYCLGDSFLVAGLVPFEETIVARLEASTGKPTLNVALIGLSPQAERQLFEDQGLPMEGRLLLHFLFEGNDLQDSRSFRRAAARPGEDSNPSLRERLVLPLLLRKLQKLTAPRLAYVDDLIGRIADEEYLFRYTGAAFAGLEPELVEITAAMDGLRAHVESAGGAYAVVMIPSKFRVLGRLAEFPAGSQLMDYAGNCSPLPKHVRAWAATGGVPYLDLTEILQAYAERGEIPWFPGDTHWNGKGNQAALEALLAWGGLEAARKR